MKYLIILAHPDRGSFNNAVALFVRDKIIESGWEYSMHDLYKEDFNPVLNLEDINRKFSFDKNIQNYSRELSDADHLVFIHPDWWGQMPAILKGWIDRVFQQGTAYEYEGPEFEEKIKILLLTDKAATVIITTDRDKGPMGIEEIWRKDILGYCGISDTEVLIHYSTRTSGIDRRNRFLEDILARIIGFN